MTNLVEELDLRPFELLVTQGYMQGHSFISKFGINNQITTATDPEDVWENGGLYIFSTTADILSLGSTNAADNQVISILGLDENFLEIEQNITLNGTTRVDIPIPLIRINRMRNVSSTDVAGNVFAYTGTGTVPTLGSDLIRGVIINGSNQTLQAVYTVPADKVAFIFREEAGLAFDAGFLGGTEFATIDFRVRNFGEVFRVMKRISDTSDGASNYQDRKVFPEPLPGKSDILLRVQEVSNTLGVWGTFDLLLIDQNELPDEFLTQIGQPEI